MGLQWNWLLKNKNLVEGGTFTTAIIYIYISGLYSHSLRGSTLLPTIAYREYVIVRSLISFLARDSIPRYYVIARPSVCLSHEWISQQESCAIAKMTARCALYQ